MVGGFEDAPDGDGAGSAPPVDFGDELFGVVGRHADDESAGSLGVGKEEPPGLGEIGGPVDVGVDRVEVALGAAGDDVAVDVVADAR